MNLNMPLVYIAIPAGDDVLDRILDRDDMIILFPVDDVQERCQRRSLPGPCRTRDQHDSLPVLREFSKDLGQVKLREGGDLVGNDSENGIDTLALPEDAGTVAAVILDVTEIQIVLFLEGFQLELVEGFFGCFR